MKRWAPLLLVVAFALPAWAHEGEDHGEPAAAAVQSQSGPRAVAASEDFELVAALEDGRLTLYLDRYASNEPVAGASVEVESGTVKAVTHQLAAGVYVLPGATFVKPGKHPLSITVAAGEAADLLATTLEVAQSDTKAPAASRSWPAWTWWAGAGAWLLALAALVIFSLSRKRERVGVRGSPSPTPPLPTRAGSTDKP